MKRFAPAVARNSEPIAEVLAQELPPSGLVLEIASGTGEHAVHFARRFPQLQWQPSDADDVALTTISAWRKEEALPNLLAPVRLDATVSAWSTKAADAILCINMVHISPWAATKGLFVSASEVLTAGAPLILYGPFIEPDVATAPSNLAFDADLRMRNAAWGLRNLTAIDEMAQCSDFGRTARYEMPANNLMLIFRKL